jgi:NADH-quinone oxidoreductase subunit N
MGLINIIISMYYYLIVVKKMYINEPTDPSPIAASLSIKVAVYAGIAGTVFLGVYPGPFIDWAVSATLMFSNIGGHTAALSLLPGG